MTEQDLMINIGNWCRKKFNHGPIIRSSGAKESAAEMNRTVNTPTQHKIKSNGSMFDGAIEDCVDTDGVNKFVKMCVTAIMTKGRRLNTDAIYRASGAQDDIKQIRKQPENKMKNLLDSELNIHTLTGALKLFFSTLKSPILSLQDFEEDLKENIEQLGDVISGKSREAKATLAYLFHHLQDVIRHPDNKMDARGLGVVFGPTLMRLEVSDVTKMTGQIVAQNRIVQLLLEHTGSIFPTSSYEATGGQSFGRYDSQEDTAHETDTDNEVGPDSSPLLDIIVKHNIPTAL